MKTKLFLFAAVVLALLAGSFAYADNIYVSFNNGTIEKLDSSGNKSTFASGLGEDPGAGSGLAFDSSGNLYASNKANGTIEKFDSSGNRTTFVSGLAGMGLAFDSGNIYVADWSNVKKFGLSGNLLQTFTSPAGAWGHCFVDVAIDSSGYLYVPGENDYAITKFTPDGNYSNFANIDYPSGIACDNQDNIYVSGYITGTITKFDSNGNRSTFVSGLSSPTGLAFDSSGNLYIANHWGYTIEKVDPSGNRSTFADYTSLQILPCFIAVQPIPEPATFLLLGFGIVVLRRK